MLKVQSKGQLVFKAAMDVFRPKLQDWEFATAEKLLKESSGIIDSILSFIQKYQVDGIGFPRSSVRSALTQKVADSRKKLRTLKKSKT